MDNDYELLYLATDDDTVKKVIYEKYKNLIYKKQKVQKNDRKYRKIQ